MELQQNTNIPKGPYQLALSSWAAKQGEPVNVRLLIRPHPLTLDKHALQSSFHKYLLEQTAVDQRNRQEVLRKLANLSQAARDADAHMQSIIDDPSITKKAEEAQIQKYFNSLSKPVQKQLNTLNEEFLQESKL